MPWKVSRPMDERVRFIAEVNAGEESFTDICKSFGIARKTGYKWVERYETLGVEGLLELPKRTRSCPHRTDQETLNRIIELRKEHPKWGPKKLWGRLKALGVETPPASSTIGQMLKRHGLVQARRRRVHVPTRGTAIASTSEPNETWCIDFKGHFALGDRTRCYPLTVTDHTTRYLLKCEELTKANEASVRVHLERAFHEFGLPLRIRSDNGPPFATTGVGGLSSLSIWWIMLGIAPERIEPAHPEQNGRHERMHRTLKEAACVPGATSALEQQRSFDRFRNVFNNERPHEALDMRTPSSVYMPSRTLMPATPRSPGYPANFIVRRLDRNGRIEWEHGGKSAWILSPLLAREPIGLEVVEDGLWRAHYGPVPLAMIDERSGELELTKLR